MLTYHEHLDTIRTSDGDTKFGVQTLVISLLLEETPLLSQPQAFDSRVILGAVAAPGDEGTAFCELVQRGFIKVRLFKASSVISAFQKALRNPGFDFSAWPVITDNHVTRHEIVRALTHAGARAALGGELAVRAEAVLRLNDAVADARPLQATGSKVSLIELLGRVPRDIQGSELGGVLETLLQHGNDSRSSIYKALRDAAANGSAQHTTAEAKAIVDSLYNYVVASSLGAQRVVTTSDGGGDRDQSVNHALRSRATVRTAIETPATDSPPKGLRAVNWTSLLDYRLGNIRDRGELLVQRQLETGEFVWWVILDQMSKVFRTRARQVDQAGKGLAWLYPDSARVSGPVYAAIRGAEVVAKVTSDLGKRSAARRFDAALRTIQESRRTQ